MKNNYSNVSEVSPHEASCAREQFLVWAEQYTFLCQSFLNASSLDSQKRVLDRLNRTLSFGRSLLGLLPRSLETSEGPASQATARPHIPLSGVNRFFLKPTSYLEMSSNKKSLPFKAECGTYSDATKSYPMITPSRTYLKKKK